jgi:hypothetical protein
VMQVIGSCDTRQRTVRMPTQAARCNLPARPHEQASCTDLSSGRRRAEFPTPAFDAVGLSEGHACASSK